MNISVFLGSADGRCQIYNNEAYKIGKLIKNKNVYFIENLKDAVELAKKITLKKHICLLSPAAPSYEYFKDFTEKGRVYKEYVRND